MSSQADTRPPASAFWGSFCDSELSGSLDIIPYIGNELMGQRTGYAENSQYISKQQTEAL